MKNSPPKRKNTADILREADFDCGDKKYVRRDYTDGTVDLITYNGNKKYWLFETFINKKILGMEYDFEYCLSSPAFCGLYFVYSTIIYDRRRAPKSKA